MASAVRRLVDSISWELEARTTGSHCGGQAKGCSTFSIPLATLDFVMCGMKVA